MAEETTTGAAPWNEREKLKGFVNWPRWADLTRTMLEEKDVWDIVEEGPRRNICFDETIKGNQMAMAIAANIKIIKEGVSDDLYTNIIDKREPHEMWKKLQAVCSQVGQGVIYSILQELLTYPKINYL